ncbi:MAG: Inner membrane protein YbaL [Syntrophaceae bacterium PtaB.Bin038]|nr:MAG: Inner membrane protein YbaL [Syntrophaceae bacterium PtaB.Bin038]
MPFLGDILLIIGLSAVVLYLCHRVGIPVIVGYLLTGIVAGPYGFGLVRQIEAVRILAELGIVALLFTIGLEFSFRNLLQLRRTALLGGSLQVLLTLFTATAVAHFLGQPPGEAILIGFLTALSSTAIVMKLLQDRAEIDTPQGTSTLGILIFQDLIIVPMMLILPLLGGAAQESPESILQLVAEEIGVIVLIVIAAKWVVPWTLLKVTQTRSRELFLLAIVMIGLAVAWLTQTAGLSLALGAFMAGLVISESEYSHQALGNILPFRDVFAGFFFVSIGMLLDLGFLAENPVRVAWMTSGILLVKALIATAAALIVGLPLRTSLLVGLALCQIGEFSFILAEAGNKYAVFTGNRYQEFLAISVLTMMATPFIFRGSPRLSEALSRLPVSRRLKRGKFHMEGARRVRAKDHLVIVGFGFNGRNLARAAKAMGIPYAVIEMNPDVVREERSKGEPIHYGDATQEAILQHVNICRARSLAVVINDAAATRRITELSRRLNPKAYIIVRTRFIQEIQPLKDLGANEVIPEEFETSVEIFSRLMTTYMVPKDEIERFAEEIRAGGYEMLRSLSREATACPSIEACLPDVEIRSFRVHARSEAVGKTLAETQMRKKYGVTLLAVRKSNEVQTIPDPDIRFEAQDLLFVVGQPDRIAMVEDLFREKRI